MSFQLLKLFYKVSNPDLKVIRGAAAGRANDVWAFGITLIEMLTGEPPFKNMDPLAAMFRIASRPPSVNNFKHSRLEAVSYDLRVSSKLYLSILNTA